MLKACGVMSTVGVAGSGLASADTGGQPAVAERNEVSTAEAQRTLESVTDSAIFADTRQFLSKRGHTLLRADITASAVDRADGVSFTDISVPLADGAGVLKVMTDGERVNTQINVSSDRGDGRSYFYDATTREAVSEPVAFERWRQIHELDDRDVTVNGDVPETCIAYGGSDICAIISLLGIAASTVVALAEPTIAGELTVLQRIGTAGSLFGGTAGACDFLEVVDGIVNCESDKYYACPVIIGFTGYFKIVPACKV